MNKLLLFLPILFLFIQCENSLKGEGDADLAQDYILDDFDAVSAKGKFKLIMIPSDSSYLSVQTHKNLIGNMKIYVQNKTLNIGESEMVDSFESYVVYLYYDKQLDQVSIAEKVYLESSEMLNFDDLDLNASNESTIKQFGINAKEVDLKVVDKAEVEISGSASKLDLKAKDFANVSLENLDVKVMDVDLGGEAEVLANVNKELKGRVLENATLKYLGNPQKDVEVKDNGEILND
ncbi:MAG: GIN domain-containing protein [Weeksellaceae bacterium]